MELNEIEHKIACNELSAAQVFTQMKQHIDHGGDDDKRIYPCDDCGKLRSKNEGGTTFTACDECWNKHFKGAQ